MRTLSSLFRIWPEQISDASLMARTNMNGHVFQLDAISPDSDGHRQIADTIAELFDTEINIEDFGNFGSAIPWAPKFEVYQKRHGDFR
jgi:hypothetical protein